MPSPFPGMDPYLERRWPSVHSQLAVYAAEMLMPSLPPGLRARPTENVFLESDDPDLLTSRREADVAIVETRSPSSGEGGVAAAEPGGVAVVEPIFVRHMATAVVDRWIEITDSTRGGRLVTAIEFLSPSNKRAGRHNERYRDKLDRYAGAGVSVVEVDLLRSSRRNLPVDSTEVPARRREAYYTCVLRSSAREWAVYPLSLRRPLPAVPIPCRQGEPDVLLPLQLVIDRIYAVGGYDDIDYGEPTEPPLRGDDSRWAAELLAERQA